MIVATPWRGNRLAIAVLLGAGTAAYANAFRGSFQFDDFSNIIGDTRIASLAEFLRHLGQMIRPATRLTFLFDRQIFGENPAGYHLLNLVLHLGCGILLYGLLWESLQCIKQHHPAVNVSSQVTVPFWTALLFVIHPIATETVTYISGRATGLMTFFYFASLYLFIRALKCERERPLRFLIFYVGSTICFVLALLSKENALTLPVALVLWAFVFYRSGEQGHSEVSQGRRDVGYLMLARTGVRLQAAFWVIAVLFLAEAGSHSRYQYLVRASFGSPVVAGKSCHANQYGCLCRWFVLFSAAIEL